MTKAEQTVRVTEATWEVMHRQKRPGDTFNDIIRRWGREAGYIDDGGDAPETIPEPDTPETE